jgi:hypothetical protein
MLREALYEGKLLKSLKIGTKFKRTTASAASRRNRTPTTAAVSTPKACSKPKPAAPAKRIATTTVAATITSASRSHEPSSDESRPIDNQTSLGRPSSISEPESPATYSYASSLLSSANGSPSSSAATVSAYHFYHQTPSAYSDFSAAYQNDSASNGLCNEFSYNYFDQESSPQHFYQHQTDLYEPQHQQPHFYDSSFEQQHQTGVLGGDHGGYEYPATTTYPDEDEEDLFINWTAESAEYLLN